MTVLGRDPLGSVCTFFLSDVLLPPLEAAVEMKPGIILYIDTHYNSLSYEALYILHKRTLLSDESQIPSV